MGNTSICLGSYHNVSFESLNNNISKLVTQDSSQSEKHSARQERYACARMRTYTRGDSEIVVKTTSLRSDGWRTSSSVQPQQSGLDRRE